MAAGEWGLRERERELQAKDLTAFLLAGTRCFVCVLSECGSLHLSCCALCLSAVSFTDQMGFIVSSAPVRREEKKTGRHLGENILIPKPCAPLFIWLSFFLSLFLPLALLLFPLLFNFFPLPCHRWPRHMPHCHPAFLCLASAHLWPALFQNVFFFFFLGQGGLGWIRIPLKHHNFQIPLCTPWQTRTRHCLWNVCCWAKARVLPFACQWSHVAVRWAAWDIDQETWVGFSPMQACR